MSANDNPTLAGLGLRVTDDRTEHPSATHFVPAGRFGPWVPGICEGERRAALRALAALVSVYCGSDHVAVGLLRHAEVDPTASGHALEEFDKLPALPRPKILSVYAAVMRPRRA
jgi:hypothetical protein